MSRTIFGVTCRVNVPLRLIYNVDGDCDDCPCYCWTDCGPFCGIEGKRSYSALWPSSRRVSPGDDDVNWRRERPEWCKLRLGGVALLNAMDAEPEVDQHE